MVSENLKMEVTPLYEMTRDSATDFNDDSDVFHFYNETSLMEEKNLVQNWRLALEGILIPCIGLPGIVGKSTNFVFCVLEYIHLYNNILYVYTFYLEKPWFYFGKLKCYPGAY